MGRSGDIQISNLCAVNVSEERRAWLLGLYFDGEIHSDSRKIWWNMTQVSMSSRKKKTLVVSFAILLMISWTFAVKKWLFQKAVQTCQKKVATTPEARAGYAPYDVIYIHRGRFWIHRTFLGWWAFVHCPLLMRPACGRSFCMARLCARDILAHMRDLTQTSQTLGPEIGHQLGPSTCSGTKNTNHWQTGEDRFRIDSKEVFRHQI